MCNSESLTGRASRDLGAAGTGGTRFDLGEQTGRKGIHRGIGEDHVGFGYQALLLKRHGTAARRHPHHADQGSRQTN